MARNLIICVGNRFAGSDDLGPRVHDALCGRPLPAGVEVVDGGLGGLALLPLVERAGRVVFVDALEGFGGPGVPVALDGGRAAEALDAAYGHDGGLAFLLKSLPLACSGPPPEVWLAGMEGPAGGEEVEEVAAMALSLAAGEATGGRASSLD